MLANSQSSDHYRYHGKSLLPVNGKVEQLHPVVGTHGVVTKGPLFKEKRLHQTNQRDKSAFENMRSAHFSENGPAPHI